MADLSQGREREKRPEAPTAQRGDLSLEERFLRLVDLGDFHYRADNFAGALDCFQDAREMVRSGAEISSEPGSLSFRIAECHRRRGNYAPALAALDEARAEVSDRGTELMTGKIFARRGSILAMMGRYTRARKCCEIAYRFLRGTNENSEIGDVELNLGTIYARTGDQVRAREHFESALSTFRRIDDQEGIASALNNLGLQYKNSCEWRESIRFLKSALQLSERAGNASRVAGQCLNLGIVHFKLGDWLLCEEYLNRARQIFTQVGFKVGLARTLLALGNLRRRLRAWDEALELYHAGAMLSAEGQFQREQILAAEFEGELYLDRGDLEAARKNLEPALARAAEIAPMGDLVNEVSRRLAEVWLALGDPARALEMGTRALSASSTIQDLYERAISCRAVGLAYGYLGKKKESVEFLDEATSSLTGIGERFELAKTYVQSALLQRHLRERDGETDIRPVTESLKRAVGIFSSLDTFGQAAEAECLIAEIAYDHQRIDEALTAVDRALEILPKGTEPELTQRLFHLREKLEGYFTEAWFTGTEELASLREVRKLFQGASGVDVVLREIIQLVVDRSYSDRGYIAYGTNGGAPEVVAQWGLPAERAEELHRSLSHVLSEAVAGNRLFISTRVSQDWRFQGVEGKALSGVKSLAVAPLNLPSGLPGYLYVDRREENNVGAYRQSELSLLSVLANLAALSIMEAQRAILARENQTLKERLGEEYLSGEVVTQDETMLGILRLAQKIADSNVSILIEGETGTGKGLLAAAVHQSSCRRNRSFVQVNCAALPEQLLESELFGHVQGAFTGAVREKIGLFKEADGGTIFLDEVDKTTSAVQAKLLHVLDKKEIRPVGSTKWVTVDTRVTCATNVDLREWIKQGKFLEDLYYRLNDFSIRVPALRERREDIPLLVDYFVHKYSAQYGKPAPTITSAVLQTLIDAPWRGNVRELEKTVKRMIVLVDDGDAIDVDLLPPDLVASPGDTGGGPGKRTLRDEVERTERRVISDALRNANWNKARVSRELKISYPNLLKKIREFGLDRRVKVR